MVEDRSDNDGGGAARMVVVEERQDNGTMAVEERQGQRLTTVNLTEN